MAAVDQIHTQIEELARKFVAEARALAGGNERSFLSAVTRILKQSPASPGTDIEEFDKLLDELDALPDRPDTDGLSGSMDHDEIIYNKPRP